MIGPKGGIQALDAALAVLHAIVRLGGEGGLGDVAREADMPASKAHRYLASFIHAGLVARRERSGRYALGPFAAEMGLAALARIDLPARAADGLEELARATGLTALVSVWGEHGATVIRWERSPAPTVTSFGLGSTLPLLTSASGRVFLAFLPERITAARLAAERDILGRTPPLPADLDGEALAELVAGIRRDRLATIDGRFIPGLRAIAAPVTDWQGEAGAAVTLIGTAEEVIGRDGAAARALRAYADALSVPRPATG